MWLSPVSSERRDGSKVIRSGQHVNQSGKQAGEGSKHD
jgi:hypothetical protein